MKKLVNGIEVELSEEESVAIQAEWDAWEATYVPLTAPPAPTKEQLLAQLNALQVQIQALA